MKHLFYKHCAFGVLAREEEEREECVVSLIWRLKKKKLSFLFKLQVPTVHKYTPHSTPQTTNLIKWPCNRGNAIESATGVYAGRGFHKDILLIKLLFFHSKNQFFADTIHEEGVKKNGSDRNILLMPK